MDYFVSVPYVENASDKPASASSTPASSVAPSPATSPAASPAPFRWGNLLPLRSSSDSQLQRTQPPSEASYVNGDPVDFQSVYIPPDSDNADQDNPFLVPGSELTWYYNYGPSPTTAVSNATSPLKLEFVPQLWGTKDDNGGDAFSSTLEPFLSDSSQNITSLLFMNEPDMGQDVGGSDVDPSDAAKLWQDQFGTLKSSHPNLQLGSPAVSNGPSGFPWLAEFFSACDGKCEPDFMAIHYYGPADGFFAYIQLVNQTFGNITSKGGIWVTEFAYPNQDDQTTQSFFNQSVAYLDQQDVVKRYSYFGSFQSDNSNVGDNVAMLDGDGKLTQIGSEYTGVTASAGSKLTLSLISMSISFSVMVLFHL
ncbi:MAG: hypothetical protein Q9159_004148 [Coniocarpon cinnabarinum]